MEREAIRGCDSGQFVEVSMDRNEWALTRRHTIYLIKLVMKTHTKKRLLMGVTFSEIFDTAKE